MLLLLRMEGGCILGLVAGGGAWGSLAYQRRQGDSLAVLWGEWQVLRMRRVGVVWLAVGLRVGLVLGVLVKACHGAWVKRWGLHPSVQGWEGVSHWQDRLWGQTLLHRHGHHNWRGGGRGHLGVHLLQMGGRPGAMFRGEHDVLLLELLLMMEVAGCCGGRQGDLTDLSALGGHSCLDWGKG